MTPKTLKEYVKECFKSLKYFGIMFISHEKLVTFNLPPLLSFLGAVAKGFFFLNLPFAFSLNVSLNSST